MRIPILPIDIIEYIFILSQNICHVCNRNYNLGFYKKISTMYFCSEICYECI
jgi:hypothetical protein